MLKVWGLEGAVPPGLKTVTVAEPALAISEARMVAASEEPLLKVVNLSEPFQRTTAPLAKLLPATLRVNPEPPAVAGPGLRPMLAGAGGGGGGGELAEPNSTLISAADAFPVRPSSASRRT